MPLSKIPNSMQDAITLSDLPTLTDAQMPAGSVLQVQASGSTAWTTVTSTSGIIGLSCSITPSSTASKVLVMMNLNGITVSTTSQYGKLELYIDPGDTLIRRISDICGYSVSHTHYNTDVTSSYLDSPSSTAALTYKLLVASSNSSHYIGYNNYATGNNRTSSVMTLLEIAG